jgi:hypothetical protein
MFLFIACPLFEGTALTYSGMLRNPPGTQGRVANTKPVYQEQPKAAWISSAASLS